MKTAPLDLAKIVKNILGFPGSEESAQSTPVDQRKPENPTPCEFGRKETIEEEMHYKRPALEPLDE